MEKPYSKIIGLPIIIEGAGKVGRITDILINTKNGKVEAFFTNTGKMKIIIPMDILYFGIGLIIGDFDDIIDAEDIINIQEILKSDIGILKSKVETVKGEYLGHVQDYYINTQAYGMTKIVVHKSFFGLLKTPDLLISARDIVEIKKNLIIVKNKWAKNFIS
ncbi:PRC-barrel domain-containing protein, partial [Patescibacteria group bacterium]|nr:PRC-barrel domain-containing protein [Patescibacteria group bacterium]